MAPSARCDDSNKQPPLFPDPLFPFARRDETSFPPTLGFCCVGRGGGRRRTKSTKHDASLHVARLLRRAKSRSFFFSLLSPTFQLEQGRLRDKGYMLPRDMLTDVVGKMPNSALISPPVVTVTSSTFVATWPILHVLICARPIMYVAC